MSEIKTYFHGSSGFVPYDDDYSCFTLYANGDKVLIDAGAQNIIRDLRPDYDIDAVFLSHIHQDHMMALYPLLAAMYDAGRERYLPIYTPETPVGKISNHVAPNNFEDLGFEIGFIEEIPRKVGNIEVDYLETKHMVKNYAYRFSTGKRELVYTGDTGLFRELKEFSADADILVVDATLSEGSRYKKNGHMTPSDVSYLLEYACPKKTVLTHFAELRPAEFKRQIDAGVPLYTARHGLELEMKRYDTVAMGGTFGPLHRGHKELLKEAFENGEYVFLGMTDDEMIKHKSPRPPPYRIRCFQLMDCLTNEHGLDNYEINMIFDIYGETLERKDMQAMVVTKETQKNLEKINRKRKELGFPEIEKILVEDVLADDSRRISSTRIRKGEIDCDGRMLREKEVYRLREEDIPFFRETYDEIISKDGYEETAEAVLKRYSPDVIVGDVSAYYLLRAGAKPDLFIYDGKTRRENADEIAKFLDEYNVMGAEAQSKKSIVSRDAYDKIFSIRDFQKRCKKHRFKLKVEGEEDLLLVPVILAYPHDSVFCIGNPFPPYGIKVFRNSPVLQERTKKLLRR
ncbi:MAG: pantetheine-phosphate adenylyltransferase [Candidatus Aenigmatarchaeota archaeon]